MSDRERGAPPGPAVKDRWWVDFGDKRREAPRQPSGPAGSRFFRAAQGFDQETARQRLTDLNMRLLLEANPPEGGWGYVRVADAIYPERERERVKNAVRLPPYARGAIVDCGRSLRVLVTGTPIGERILELALGEALSFDCWVHGEWVREAVFDDVHQATAALGKFIQEYLSPEGIAAWEGLRARA